MDKQSIGSRQRTGTRMRFKFILLFFMVVYYTSLINNIIVNNESSYFPALFQAMLFHWTPTLPSYFNKKGTNQTNPSHPLPTLSYWVCGRVFDNSVVTISSGGSTSSTPTDTTECYVAYHDSAPQNMIELAFRIAFGVHV